MPDFDWFSNIENRLELPGVSGTANKVKASSEGREGLARPSAANAINDRHQNGIDVDEADQLALAFIMPKIESEQRICGRWRTHGCVFLNNPRRVSIPGSAEGCRTNRRNHAIPEVCGSGVDDTWS